PRSPQQKEISMTRNRIVPCALALLCAVIFIGNSHAEKLRDVLKGLITEEKKPETAPTEADRPDSTKNIVNTLTGSQSVHEEIKVGEGVAAPVLGAAPVWKAARAQR